MEETTLPEELVKQCQHAVDAAIQAGADHAEVYATDFLDLEIGIQKNDLDQVATARERSFGIRVIRDQRQGFATTNRVSALSESTAEALALARISPPDPLVDLPEPQSFGAGVHCIDSSFDDVRTEEMVKLSMKLLKQTLARDSRLTVDTAGVSFSRSTSAIASSKGIAHGWRGDAAGGSIFGMALDGSKVGSFAYDGARVRTLENLEEELVSAFSRFSLKAIGALGAGAGESFRGPVLLPPECVSEFLVPKIVSAASSKSVRQGRSPLTGKIEESIAVPEFHLSECGPGLDAYPLCPFDREGLTRVPMNLIEGGVLKNYLFDSYEARAAGVPCTAHAQGGASSLPIIGIGSIQLQAGTVPVAQLQNMDRGIIVTRFSGSYEAASGDFSGVVKGGFLVKQGEARPIQETTLAGNIWTALKNISGISLEREILYGTRSMPWVRLEDISVTAGQSA